MVDVFVGRQRGFALKPGNTIPNVICRDLSQAQIHPIGLLLLAGPFGSGILGLSHAFEWSRAIRDLCVVLGFQISKCP